MATQFNNPRPVHRGFRGASSLIEGLLMWKPTALRLDHPLLGVNPVGFCRATTPQMYGTRITIVED